MNYIKCPNCGKQISSKSTSCIYCGISRNIIEQEMKIKETLNEKKKQGIGILLVAEDLDQLCAISDRVMVMHDGKNMGIVDPRKTTKEKIGLMMMGKNNFNLEESK